MENTFKKVFITKYALTSGIIECEGRVSEDGKYMTAKPEGYAWPTTFSENEFCLTKHEAVLHNS